MERKARRVFSRSYIFFIARRDPWSVVGLCLVAVVVVLALAAPLVARYGSETADATAVLLPPSAAHWFGTDNSGMDIFSRTIYAPRIDLVIALSGTVLSLVIGIPYGALIGYFRGPISETLARILDVIQSFPILILSMALVTVTGSGIFSIIYAIALLNAPIYAKLMRSQFVSLRERTFVRAARCVGNGDMRIIFRHLVPNALGPVFAQSAVSIGWGILLTAGLSFVGIGVKVPTAEWGAMINQGAQSIISGQWWIAFFPGLFMTGAVLGFNLLSDALQDAVALRKQ